MQPFRGVKIVAAAVGDPTILATLASQRGEWSATQGAEVTIKDTAVDPKSAHGADLLLFRGDRLGDLIDARTLALLPASVTNPKPVEDTERSEEEPPAKPPPDPFQFTDIVPAYRDDVSKYGNERVALPYGGTALVLVFHRAAFEREENRKAAADAKLALEPPKTWTQFDALAKFFQGRDWDGDGASNHGIALALGADGEGVADATYLARAASVGLHRDAYSFLFDADTMEPRIESPPFVEVLRDLAALKACGPPGADGFDADAARAAFAQGNVAMLIDRAERLAGWGKGKAIGVAPLPGSDRVYDPARKVWEPASPVNQPSELPYGGGWLIAVAASSPPGRREAAIDFMKYLVGPETSSRIRANRDFPILPIRVSQLGQGPADPTAAPGVDTRKWADAVSRTLLAARVVPGLRIPEAPGYLDDLAKGRVAAVRGESAAAALQGVAKAWGERTKRLGKERQLWHYRRSLNSLPTAPEPPER
jgi:multiple sugar transport system substrate-binding protein